MFEDYESPSEVHRSPRVHHKVLQDSPQGSPQDSPQGSPQDSPQGSPQDSPQGSPQGDSGGSQKSQIDFFICNDNVVVIIDFNLLKESVVLKDADVFKMLLVLKKTVDLEVFHLKEMKIHAFSF